MKKLLLLTTVCVVAAAPAFADRDTPSTRDKNQSRYSETYYRYDAPADRAEYVDIQTPDDMTSSKKVSRTFNLVDGGRALVKGETIYLQPTNGTKYLAPTGSYTSTNGITLVAESGLLLRLENPAQRYYVDADRDGIEVQKAGKRRAH